MKLIDCRNMACPAPVLATKKALEEDGDKPVQVLVDAGAAQENVTRFAKSRGYLVDDQPTEGGISLTIYRDGSTCPVADEQQNRGTKVILICSDQMGDGPDEFGRLLMKNFIITLLDMEELPRRMLFINSAVFLTTEGSEVLEALEALAGRGVEILSCGLCLDYFNRKEQLKAGTVTNMFTTVESLMQADSVIRI
ncbi:selenium metabolism protein YedF [Trichlorobacter thiogenes]|uniref:Selenium metabolism protein YedF n=1 Tax=Trichlorobacter thiogenes TaxID=115783 RepID=A0A1T4R1R3_9BACT|nr:sulfurtransferase-like selenium metabolism protein YedF [Trichlorobacter thiogenes]SKA09944.1 selenium metabolism protein YedF [Trichlorobacter thiogenes]